MTRCNIPSTTTVFGFHRPIGDGALLAQCPAKRRELAGRCEAGKSGGVGGELFPQIAGSYRGSYFSKVGLLITEIAAAPSLPSSFVSLHLSPCVLITEIAAAPSLPSSFVSLHLSPCVLITEIAAAPSLPSSFVSLHLSPCMLITEIAAAPSLPSSFVSLQADYRNRCRS